MRLRDSLYIKNTIKNDVNKFNVFSEISEIKIKTI